MMRPAHEYCKKLIEVALPLEAINREAAREKSIRHGHPSTLHLWWARRPLAACRAVLFASLVDDPSSHPDKFPTEEAQETERKRLFGIIEELVKWENSNNPAVLKQAREEILKSTNGNPPPVLDPFCGGGSIPLEAQRLGLEAHASDLNPVAVLITKALIEIPPKFAGKPPIHPGAKNTTSNMLGWHGAQGLAEDVRYYGEWMRQEAEKRIGHLYPKVKVTKELAADRPNLKPLIGQELTVIAWLWARTIASPDPTYAGVHVPLVKSFSLSTKKDKLAWVEPVVDKARKSYRFTVQSGKPTASQRKSIEAGTKLARGAKFRCLLSDQPIPEEYLKAEAKASRMGARLMAIVAEGTQGRVYLPPIEDQEGTAKKATPAWSPDQQLADDPRNIWCVNYGLDTFAKLFTPRQLVALTTFSDLVSEARERVWRDAVAAGMKDDGVPLNDGGTGAQAYAEAVSTYLAFALDKCTDYWNTIATWMPRGTVGHAFSKQAIPMTWDFPEANPLAEFHCAWHEAYDWVAKAMIETPAGPAATVKNLDATAAINGVTLPLVSTDPPYYDNISYADLSDFFYVWMRRSLNKVYPNIFSTLLVPKAQELVASPYRFGGDKEKAKVFFETGLGQAFAHIREKGNPDYPISVYYAFKQAEAEEDDEKNEGNGFTASTGWETMLEGLLKGGFSITGTWPMRTERTARSISIGTNALASSIVLACRPRPESAPMTTRRDFINTLKRELPIALKTLQHGNIAPVDLAQAAIGPGMAVFSRYSKVVEADGSAMKVRAALQLINQVLDETLSEQESEFDPDTRWALAWFEQQGMETGAYGTAETLATAKNTAISGLVEAGILEAKGGKVRLLRREDLSEQWDPARDVRLPIWELTQRLIRALEQSGEVGAAEILKTVGALGEVARDLAYRLYTICERKGWAQEAIAYNSLVVAWPEIVRLAQSQPRATEVQESLI